MSKIVAFKSILAPFLTAFVREYVMKGYKSVTYQNVLRTFDNYLFEIKHSNIYI